MALPAEKNLWIETLAETGSKGMSNSHFHD
jgi:hypothetical protein